MIEQFKNRKNLKSIVLDLSFNVVYKLNTVLQDLQILRVIIEVYDSYRNVTNESGRVNEIR